MRSQSNSRHRGERQARHLGQQAPAIRNTKPHFSAAVSAIR
jgi:hypothetical protein